MKLLPGRLQRSTAGTKLVAAVAIAIVMSSSEALAASDTVYRCGADGRTYSQEPCAGGKKLEASDARTPQQRIDGERAAAREKALGDNLERDRRAQAASQRAAIAAASFKALPPPVPASAATVRVRHIIRRR